MTGASGFATGLGGPEGPEPHSGLGAARGIPDAVNVVAGELSRAMHLAAGLAPRKFIPILECVLLSVSGDGLEIVASNLDLELRQTVSPTATGEPFVIAVDAQRLSAIAGSCQPDAPLSLSAKDGRLTVKAGRSRWTLPTLSANDFPILQASELCEPISLPGKKAAEAFGRTHPFVIDDITRKFLGGVWLHESAGLVRAVGMDGKRGIFVDLGAPMPRAAEPILLSVKFAQLAEKLSATSSSVSLAWGGGKARLECGSSTITAKALDEKLPEYWRALPGEVAEPILVDPANLRAAARRASLVNTAKTKCIKFVAANDKVTLSLADPVGGVSAEEVPASLTGSHEFGVNPDFLEAVCAAVGGETIEIHKTSEAMSGALIHRVPRHDAFAFIFPMAI